MKKKLKICIVRSMYNSTLELFQSANRELEKKKYNSFSYKSARSIWNTRDDS